MPQPRSLLPFPGWLVAVDLVAALPVVAGLFLRNQPERMAAMSLPTGVDLLLLGVGALGVVGCGACFGRIAMTSARSRSAR